MNNDIEYALASLRAQAARFAKAERYYEGDHDLAFATEKFANTFGSMFREFALNLCPVICDALRDKLQLTGFGVDAVSEPPASVGGPVAGFRATLGPPAHAGGSDTRLIWHRNRMVTRAGEVHKEALRCGNAYMIVWPDSDGRAVLYPNRAASVTVRYDEELPGVINWAAKMWMRADKRTRLNLFYADRIERYITRRSSETGAAAPRDFVAFDEDGEASGDAHLRNPLGVVPVFHFANNADIGQTGRSELEAAMPIQDGLNKAVLDMLVAMEYSAYRQRWAAGIEIEYDLDGKVVPPFKAGVDHVWITENPNARFGDFDAAQLEQFLKVKDSFRVDMASVTGTPLHYFLQNSRGFPSGESLRKAETRFIAKVRDRQAAFGQVWADLMAFAISIETKVEPPRLIAKWEDASPQSERELLENILLKKQIGLPVRHALVEAGYGEAEIDAMMLRQYVP